MNTKQGPGLIQVLLREAQDTIDAFVFLGKVDQAKRLSEFRHKIGRTVQEVRKLHARYDSPMIRIGFGPLSPQWCTKELLKDIALEAKRLDTIIHIHAVQTVFQKLYGLKTYHRTLISYLNDLGLLGSNLVNLIITIAIVMTPRFARLSHGQLLKLKESEYVIAAQAIGAKVPRIIVRHIFPNIFGELLVAGTLWVGVAIRLEANLAFIGLGVQPPTPTWGNMIREGIDVMINAPWISICSGLAILVTILAFNMLGDGLRDIADPKLRGV